MKDIKDIPTVKRKAGGYFGVEWFMGRREWTLNARFNGLPKEPYNGKPYKMEFVKYNGVASGLGSEYYFREGQKAPLTYYHHLGTEKSLYANTVFVGATSERAREARTIDNYVKERTRGFAVQIALEGRGVKAYYEPEFPHLKARLGVGAKVKDLSEFCMIDPDINIHVSKKGDFVVVHGPNKARVGTLAMKLKCAMNTQLQTYTGKGAHLAFHPEKKKKPRKK